MPARISESVKRNVILEYMKGTFRDENASKNGLSGGAVTNIISEWKTGLDQHEVEDMRDLAVSLKKLGITPPQCASGFRVSAMLQRLGVNEENFGQFVSEIYNKCREQDLDSDEIVHNLKEMVKLCQSMPFSKITDHIQQKKSEETQLVKDVLELGDEKYFLQEAVNKQKAQLADLGPFSELKIELERVGVPVEDIPKVAKVIQGLWKLGYNTERVITLISNLDSLSAQRATLENQLKFLEFRLAQLEGQCQFWEGRAAADQQMALICEELEEAGFGISRLRLLRDKIKEIATEHKIPENVAAENLFRDVEENYDRKLGYQSQIRKGIEELNSLTLVLSFKREVAKVLGKLTSMGYREQDILKLAAILEIYSIDVESFATDLRKYGPLKEVVEQLNLKVKELESEMTSLEEQGRTGYLADNSMHITDNQARNSFLVWQANTLRVTMIQVAQKLRDRPLGFFSIH